MTDSDGNDTLRLALWLAIVSLVAAVPPVWPYGFYVLLRLVVTGVAIYALVALRGSSPPLVLGLAVVALVFNPLIPVHLPKVAWVAIDLGVAGFFLMITRRVAVAEE